MATYMKLTMRDVSSVNHIWVRPDAIDMMRATQDKTTIIQVGRATFVVKQTPEQIDALADKVRAGGK